MRIAALLTCFNRRDQTLACLHALADQKPTHVELNYIVVDDGSTDGTGEAIRREFPNASVLRGDGSLYWCGGMRMAWTHAAESDPDYYFLINDDTILDSNALKSLLGLAPSPKDRVIAVAAIRDPATGMASYGGLLKGVGLIAPDGEAHPCDTLNANAALVTRTVFNEIGILHHAYSHAMGDLDYGYLATRRAIRILQSPHSLGTCSRNSVNGNWMDRSLPRAERMKKLRSKKGLPFFEWMEYNRRNSGFAWPLKTVSPYIRVILGI